MACPHCTEIFGYSLVCSPGIRPEESSQPPDEDLCMSLNGEVTEKLCHKVETLMKTTVNHVKSSGAEGLEHFKFSAGGS